MFTSNEKPQSAAGIQKLHLKEQKSQSERPHISQNTPNSNLLTRTIPCYF